MITRWDLEAHAILLMVSSEQQGTIRFESKDHNFVAAHIRNHIYDLFKTYIKIRNVWLSGGSVQRQTNKNPLSSCTLYGMCVVVPFCPHIERNRTLCIRVEYNIALGVPSGSITHIHTYQDKYLSAPERAQNRRNHINGVIEQHRLVHFNYMLYGLSGKYILTFNEARIHMLEMVEDLVYRIHEVRFVRLLELFDLKCPFTASTTIAPSIS